MVCLLGACTGLGPSVERAVPPEALPALEAELAREPGNPLLQERLAISLAAAGRCDDASVIARDADVPSHGDAAWPALVQGVCREQADQMDEARGFYLAYLGRYPESSETAAVRGRLLLVEEQIAVRDAQVGAQAEPGVPPSESSVAVLPMTVEGDESYRAIGRGLAAQVSADLIMLDRFQTVERLRLDAVMAELQLSAGSALDPTTAPRLGRVVRAGRLVDGLATLESSGPATLRADIVGLDGQPVPVAPQSGRLEELLRLEKELVFAISRSLGYEVSQAERTRILQNGTQNLQAFLAYSEGLEAQALGNYEEAAQLFGQAFQADPSFDEARQAAEAAAGASVAGQPTADVGTLVAASASQAEAALNQGALDAVTTGVMVAGLGDVAATQSEQITSRIGSAVAPYISITRGPVPVQPETNRVTVTVMIPIPGS